MRTPPVRSREADGDSLHLKLDITPDLDCFRGHFPEMPVLPGVLQLDWAITAAREEYGLVGNPRDIRRLKFKNVLSPPASVDLVLTQTAALAVQFRFTSGSIEYSEGRLYFPEQNQ